MISQTISLVISYKVYESCNIARYGAKADGKETADTL